MALKALFKLTNFFVLHVLSCVRCMDVLLITTICLSTLGAFANVLLWAKSFKDITSYEGLRTLILGVIIGVVWYFMRVEHNVPDSVVSFVVGYAGKDAIDAIVQKFKPFKEGESKS